MDENPDSLVFAPLADAYRKEGKLEEALTTCKKGLEKHPSYTSARVVLGRIFQDQEKADEAQVEFKKVLDQDPDNLMAHSLLGSLFLQKNDFQGAIEEYQKVLTLNPDDEETQTLLKQAIERAAGEQKPSKPIKKEAPPADKKTPAKESTATLTIAELYLKQGHFDKAIEVYQELLADDPQNLMLRQKLSEVVNRRQKDSAVDIGVSKIKKGDFVQPPDQKEDSIADEEKSADKQEPKPKRIDDSKFTSEDILQVMRRSGKDDAVVDEKPSQSIKKNETHPPAPVKEMAKEEAIPELKTEQVDGLKGILAELNAVSGIIRCVVMGREGITIVSLGETSNNADLGKETATIFQSTNRSVAQLQQGKLQQILITAETGHILLVSFSHYVLIVLANSKINLGLLRLALDSALKKLEKIL